MEERQNVAGGCVSESRRWMDGVSEWLSLPAFSSGVCVCGEKKKKKKKTGISFKLSAQKSWLHILNQIDD